MTNFTWWASLVPPGRAMCCLCFEAKPIEEFWVDGDGVRWDVCQKCKATEEAMIARRTGETWACPDCKAIMPREEDECLACLAAICPVCHRQRGVHPDGEHCCATCFYPRGEPEPVRCPDCGR